jgi:hypothetical protein
MPFSNVTISMVQAALTTESSLQAFSAVMLVELLQPRMATLLRTS